MESFDINYLKLILLGKNETFNNLIDSFFCENIRHKHVNAEYCNHKIILNSVFDELLSYSFELNERKSEMNIVNQKYIVGKVLTESDLENFKSNRFAYCYIPFEINFENYNFFESLVFEGCVFAENVIIRNCNFQMDFVITGSTFEKETDFSHNVIKRKFNGDCCRFNSKMNSSNVFCGSDFTIRSAILNDVCEIHDCIFESKTDFSHLIIDNSYLIIDKAKPDPKSTCFFGVVDFASCIFKNFAIFDKVHIASRIRFNSAVFMGKTFFQNCTISEIDCTTTRFGIYTSFDDTIFEKEIIFKGTKFIGDFRSTNTKFIKNTFFYDVEVGADFLLDKPTNEGSVVLYKLKVNGDSEIYFNINEDKSLILVNSEFNNHTIIDGKFKLINFNDTLFRGPVLFKFKNSEPFPIYTLNVLFNDTLSVIFDSVDKNDLNKEKSNILLFSKCLFICEGKGAEYVIPKWALEEGDESDYTYKIDKLTVDDELESISVVKEAYKRQGKYRSVDTLSRLYNDKKLEQCKKSGNPKDNKSSLRHNFNLKYQLVTRTMVKCLFDYGLSIYRILSGMFLLICVFGVLLFISQWKFDSAEVFFKSFLDSAVCFLTMSIGINLDGAPLVVVLICVIEGLFGVFSMSFLVTAVARKIYR